MKFFKKQPCNLIWYISIVAVVLFSCDSDILDSGNGGGGGTTSCDGVTLTPDQLNNLFTIDKAIKIDGALPAAPSGNVQIDVKDTISIIKNASLGDLISFKYDHASIVSKFNVQVVGASSYWQVDQFILSNQLATELDIISRLFLIFDYSEIVCCDLTFSIIIQTLDKDNIPLDQFNKLVNIRCSIEDDSNTSDDETTAIPFPLGSNEMWVWNHSILSYSGVISQITGPGIPTKINTYGWGCCDDKGKSTYPLNDYSCLKTTTSKTWVELLVNDYVMRQYEYLKPYTDGSVIIESAEEKSQYYPWLTDFCAGDVGYEFGVDAFVNQGTHDYETGDEQMFFQWPTKWQGGYIRYGGNVDHTKRTLIITRGIEGSISADVYHRTVIDPGTGKPTSEWND